jgi:hypothetical protein
MSWFHNVIAVWGRRLKHPTRGRVKLVLFGLRPSGADQYITGGAFKGQCGLFTRDQRGAVVRVDRAGACTPGSRRPHSEGAELRWRSGGSTMTEGPGAEDAPPTFTDEERAPGQDVLSGMTELERRETLAWVGEHLPEVRRSVSGQRFLYWSLGICLVAGLAANVGGYLLKSSVTTEPLGLVADLLYELGYALWTGVVVVVFVQVYPEVKRRQFKQALAAYEAAQREKARAGSDQASGDDAAPTAR